MQRQRVLIVDDDDTVREALVDELAEIYEVDAAPGGRDAMARLGEQTYDAVISDLRMPEISGLEVLEETRRRQPDAVRILLTGYLDDEARKATLREGAPFKIGKPWHDAIDVTLRRAFEHRAERQRWRELVEQALSLGDLRDELTREDGAVGAGRVLVRRAAGVRDLESLAVAWKLGDGWHTVDSFAGKPPAPEAGVEWRLEEPISACGTLRVTATGRGEGARVVAARMIDQACRVLSEDAMARLWRIASLDSRSREQVLALLRQASLGTMAGALMHELASVVVAIQAAVSELGELAGPYLIDEPGGPECLEDAATSSERLLDLFRSMRAFLQGRGQQPVPCPVDSIVQQAVTLCACLARRNPLHVSPVGVAVVVGVPPLLTQVLVNLLRNAFEASPPTGTVDLLVEAGESEVVFRVIDDGPGVPAELQGRVFEPFFSTKGGEAGTGLGLAISLSIARQHGGSVSYQRAPGRGACFVLSLPRHR